MTSHSENPPAPKTVSRWRLRFSLRTLLLLTLLIGSALSLYRNWPAWVVERTLTHEGYVHSAAFSPDGKRLVTAGGNHNFDFNSEGREHCAVWDLSSQKIIVQMRGHKNYVFSALFSPNGLLVASGGTDHTARVWDTATGKELAKLTHTDEQVGSVAFSPDGNFITTACDSTATVWSITGEKKQLLRGNSSMASSAFSPDGQRLVTAEHGDYARVWDVATGKVLTTLFGHTDDVVCAEFSPDGKWIVTGSEDATARIWDSARGTEHRKLVGHPERVNTAVFSPDGRRVLTGGEHDGIRIWDVATGEELASFSVTRSDRPAFLNPIPIARSAAFSLDGKRIVVTGGEIVYILFNQRPEYWWGPMALIEFWLTLLLLAAALWNVKEGWKKKSQ